MKLDLAFAAVRQGDLTAERGWELLAPVMTRLDQKVAEELVDTLASWTWKAVDRRRRDDGLREWIDVLNRIEGFLTKGFARLASKVELLAELLHLSISVADLPEISEISSRKHVVAILAVLADRSGEWTRRAVVMRALELKPANTTRLMVHLAETGWIEQQIEGREVSYRLSVDGAQRVAALDLSPDFQAEMDRKEFDDGSTAFEKVLLVRLRARGVERNEARGEYANDGVRFEVPSISAPRKGLVEGRTGREDREAFMPNYVFRMSDAA